MATLPISRGASVAPAATPGLRVTPETFGGGNTARPLDVGGLGEQVNIAYRHKDDEEKKADQLFVLAKDNELDSIQQTLELQAKALRGHDALQAEELVGKGWKEAVQRVRGTMQNDRQLESFDRAVLDREHQLLRGVRSHTAAEIDQFTKEEAQTSVAKSIDAAAKNYNTPDLRDAAIGKVGAVVSDFGKWQGQSTEVTQWQVANATSKAHVAVVERMLSTGDDLTASAYYAKVKASLTGDDAAKVDRALEVGSTEGEGMRGAGAVWRALGPKSINEPVRVSALEDAIRDRYADHPKIIKAAIAELRTRATAFNAEQTEVTATNKAAVLGAFNDGASLSQLIRMPQYRALAGDAREAIKEHVVDRSHALEQRAESEQTRHGFAKYWEYSNPATLDRMSENQIIATQPEIGRALVTQLLDAKRSLVKNESEVRVADIDNDLFKSLAHRAGFNPYASDAKASVEDKAALGQLKMTVETEIDVAQQKAGKRLTTDEKRAIMNSVLDRKVMLDEWGRDPEKIAATLTPGERAKAYVPLAKIPAGKVAQMKSLMRQSGIAVTDERVQRAYAAALLGDEDTWQVLTGQRKVP